MRRRMIEPDLLTMLGIDCQLDPVADLDTAANRAGCYLVTGDADAWHARMAAAGLPVTPIADQPWGMREFSLTDPWGNEIRIGRGVD